MKKSLLNKLIALEIVLFPWINASEVLEYLFYLLLVINILFWIALNNKFLKNPSFNRFESFFLIFLLITLLYPFSHWTTFNLENPVLRTSIFLLRFIFLKGFDIKDSILTFNLLATISSVLILIGWIAFDQGDSWRLTFPYGDPNYIGFIFGVYFLISLRYFSEKNRLLSLITILFCLSILIATGSRGSFIAISIILVFYLVKMLFFRRNYKFFALILLSVFVFQKPINNFITSLVIIERILDPRKSDIGAFNSRFNEIETSLNYFESNPETIIFGNGLSSSSNTRIFNSNVRIHNTFAAILFEQGIIGIILIFLVFYEVFLFTRFNNNHFLLFFLIINSLSVYLITNYFFYVCLRILTIEKK